MNKQLCSGRKFAVLLIALVFVMATAAGSHSAEPRIREAHAVRQSKKDRPETPTVKELAGKSDMVVLGKVLKKSSRWVGKKIVTSTDIKPVRFFKGKSADTTISIITLGGVVGNIVQEFTHEVVFQEGETSIFFLARTPRDKKFLPGVLRPVDEHAKIRLLKPTDSPSRLKNNRRLNKFIEEVAAEIKRGERR